MKNYILSFLLFSILFWGCKSSKEMASEKKQDTPFEVKQEKDVPQQSIINGTPQQNPNTGARPK